MTDFSELKDDVRKRHVILFVGSGISAVAGLPNWSGLIKTMAKDLEYDSDLFLELGTYPALAEYYKICKGNVDELVEWMKREWTSPPVPLERSIVHTKIIEADFPIIYTTNYDPLIEKAYKLKGVDFTKIARGEDIQNAREGVTQIVKFHGDLDIPGSLVLTESDYFERLRFETELDIKLRADLLRYSVLFVGYSLSDVNVRNMLYRLSLFRSAFSAPSSSLQSYIYADRRNEIQAQIFNRWGIKTLYSDSLDRRLGLEKFFSSLLK